MGKENEKIKELTLLDIVSDYAWHEMDELRKEGFRYVDGDVSQTPDGDINIRIRASETLRGAVVVDFSVP